MSELRAAQLQDLPWELIQHILSLLPDAKSLHSASVSCRLLRDSFRSHEHSICSDIANNVFDHECLHEVFATYSSARTAAKNWSLSKTRRFIDWYVSPKNQSFAPKFLRLKMLHSMDRLHLCIQNLVDDFSQSAISDKNREADRETSPTITATERRRFIRAFYRFEIYCNIFGSRIKKPFRLEELAHVLFNRFAPWETEQLACVHDFLMFKVTAILDSLVKTSEPWTSTFPGSWVRDRSDVSYAQYQLSRGLIKLSKVFVSYNARSGNFMTASEDILRHGDFLEHALRRSGRDKFDLQLCDLNKEQQKEVIAPPTIKDSDSGPEDVWRWAYQDEYPDDFWHAVGKASLRQWAYVMWDRERLDAWSVLDNEWEQDLPLSDFVFEFAGADDFDDDYQIYRDIGSHCRLLQDDIKSRER